jgi:Phage integrase, N-terminal SAM-like domain
MDTALTVLEPLALPAELTAPLKLAADFAKASKAPATQAAYGSDFRIFAAWCRDRGLSALPATAAALCGFLADEAAAGKRASTLGRRLAAIRYFHRAAGYDTPTGDEKVKAVLSGIRRTIGAAPVRKKAATADITIAMAATGTSMRELREPRGAAARLRRRIPPLRTRRARRGRHRGRARGPANYDPTLQNRPGRPGPQGRHPAGRDCLPGRSPQGLARGRRHH